MDAEKLRKALDGVSSIRSVDLSYLREAAEAHLASLDQEAATKKMRPTIGDVIAYLDPRARRQLLVGPRALQKVLEEANISLLKALRDSVIPALRAHSTHSESASMALARIDAVVRM